MDKYLEVLLVILFVLESCNVNNEGNIVKEKKGLIYTLNYNTCKRKPFKEICKIKEVIPLDTNENGMFGDVRKMVIEDSLLFIQDKTLDRILIFNLKGSYMGQIGKQGMGPCEYGIIYDFNREKNKKRTLIYDGSVGKMYYYKDNSDLCKEIHLISGSKFYNNNTGIWIYMGNQVSKENRMNDKNAYNLIYLENNKIKKHFCPFAVIHANREVIRSPVSNFTRFNENLLFSYYFSDTVYTLSNTTAFPYIYVDFGENALRLESFNNKTIPDFLKYLSKSDKLYLTGNIFGTKDYLIIEYNRGYLFFSEKVHFKSFFFDRMFNKKIKIGFTNPEKNLIYCLQDLNNIEIRKENIDPNNEIMKTIKAIKKCNSYVLLVYEFINI
jgi:hypothetical protein